jgi:short-subunit dehydrogenase
VEETPMETAHVVFETNYFAMLRMIQAVLPAMRRQGSGVIANVSSASGRIGIPFQAQYAASKFAVEGLSESLYHETRPLGIRVLLIEPGDVGTTIWAGTEKHLPGESSYGPALRCFLAVKEREMGGKADTPERVAQQIAKAVLSDTGRFRYPVARMAGLILMARKLLPDWVFFKLIARNYRLRD